MITMPLTELLVEFSSEVERVAREVKYVNWGTGREQVGMSVVIERDVGMHCTSMEFDSM